MSRKRRSQSSRVKPEMRYYDASNMDPEIIRVLEQYTIEHPPPFSHEELEAVGLLSVYGQCDLSQLRICQKMRMISLINSDEVNLDFIKMWPQLWSVSFQYSALHDIQALVDKPLVKSVELYCCRVEDITPLLTLPLFENVELVGLPLTEHSFFEVLPQLVARRAQERTFYNLSIPSEDEWRLTRRLFDRGLHACFYRKPRSKDNFYIAAVGTKHFVNAHWHAVKPLSIELLEELLLRDDLTVEMLIDVGHRYLDAIVENRADTFRPF